MQVIFGLLYSFLFLSYFATGLFIIYHLLRYSVNRKMAFFSVIFFSGVLIVLLFTNAFLFFTMPWSQILPDNSFPALGV